MHNFARKEVMFMPKSNSEFLSFARQTTYRNREEEEEMVIQGEVSQTH